MPRYPYTPLTPSTGSPSPAKTPNSQLLSFFEQYSTQVIAETPTAKEDQLDFNYELKDHRTAFIVAEQHPERRRRGQDLFPEFEKYLRHAGYGICYGKTFFSFVNDSASHWSLIKRTFQNNKTFSREVIPCKPDGACGVHAMVNAVLNDDDLKENSLVKEAARNAGLDLASKESTDMNKAIDFAIHIIQKSSVGKFSAEEINKTLVRLQMLKRTHGNQRYWVENEDLEVFAESLKVVTIEKRHFKTREEERRERKERMIQVLRNIIEGSGPEGQGTDSELERFWQRYGNNVEHSKEQVIENCKEILKEMSPAEYQNWLEEDRRVQDLISKRSSKKLSPEEQEEIDLIMAIENSLLDPDSQYQIDSQKAIEESLQILRSAKEQPDLEDKKFEDYLSRQAHLASSKNEILDFNSLSFSFQKPDTGLEGTELMDMESKGAEIPDVTTPDSEEEWKIFGPERGLFTVKPGMSPQITVVTNLEKNETIIIKNRWKDDATKRGNRFKFEEGIYDPDKKGTDIEESFYNILVSSAAKTGLSYQDMIRAIAFAKEYGGLSSIDKETREEKNIPPEYLEFSKTFQRRAKECGIYSGRENAPNRRDGRPVGCRLTFIPDRIVKNINRIEGQFGEDGLVKKEGKQRSNEYIRELKKEVTDKKRENIKAQYSAPRGGNGLER